MEITLYKHNQSAYHAALQMLKDTGKAAIIHPTGTGKSFIGFKLCEDFPDKVICWISPSEYIFRTQVENLVASIKRDAALSGDVNVCENGSKCSAKARRLAAYEKGSCGGAANGMDIPENIRFYTYAKIMSIISYWMNSTAAARKSGDRECRTC